MKTDDIGPGGELLKLVFQYEQLDRLLRPKLPEIGQKLVADLLSTGTPAKNIGRAIGKSPGYVRAIAGGQKALGATQIVRLVQFAAAERAKQDDVDNQ